MNRLIPCKLQKGDGKGGFLKRESQQICQVGSKTAGAVTARYYKGISANGDNIVLVKR